MSPTLKAWISLALVTGIALVGYGLGRGTTRRDPQLLELVRDLVARNQASGLGAMALVAVVAITAAIAIPVVTVLVILRAEVHETRPELYARSTSGADPEPGRVGVEGGHPDCRLGPGARPRALPRHEVRDAHR